MRKTIAATALISLAVGGLALGSAGSATADLTFDACRNYRPKLVDSTSVSCVVSGPYMCWFDAIGTLSLVVDIMHPDRSWPPNSDDPESVPAVEACLPIR